MVSQHNVKHNIAMYSVVQHVASEQKLGGHNIDEQINKLETNVKNIVLDLQHRAELKPSNLLKPLLCWPLRSD